MFFIGTKVARGQWVAISLQVCGIVVTQYKPGGAAFPLSTYLVLLFATTVSAVASVYNQKLCKGSDASMHVMNMALYLSGAAINLLLHIVTRLLKSDEPGFFTGYGSIGSIMVIVSNVTIGLAMTAVYKYADAIIKCFATAMSTAVLLYLSPVLFGTDMSFLVLPGTSTVFIATWLYMEATPAKPTGPPPDAAPASPKERGIVGKLLYLLSPKGQLRHIGLGSATVAVLLVLSLLTAWETRNRESLANENPAAATNDSTNIVASKAPNVLESPFKNTLAYVRWNTKHEERIPTIKHGYTPFFHTVHYSMPELGVGERGSTRNSVNLTHDSFEDAFWGYRAVRDTMSIILKQTTEEEIDGLLFFHFDVWLDPLGFADMDFGKMWFPDSDEPKYLCMKDPGRYPEWWGWGQGFHEKSLQATKFAAGMHGDKYVIDAEEWCVGYVDLFCRYLVPSATGKKNKAKHDQGQ